jgi:hypothetical protein
MAKKQSGIGELTKASHHRLQDARALLAARRWRGAMYLAGLAIECQLKTKLMQRFNCRTLEELEAALSKRRRTRTGMSLFIHELTVLTSLLDCRDRMWANPAVWRRFAFVNQWSPAWRYVAHPGSREEASDFIAATEHVMRWINANT